MKSTLDRAAAAWLRWAVHIIPRNRRVWGEAMAAELDAAPSGSQRARFALGCLTFAVASWGQSQQGLVWIGRGLISAGLVALSVVGAFAANRLDEVPQVTLTAACVFYSFGGLIALSSLGAFRGYAAGGAALAGAAFLYLQNATATSWSKLCSAIAMEASVIMAGLMIVSTVLILFRDLDTRSPDL